MSTRFTTHTIKAAQHGSKFFLEHPNAAKELEAFIASKGIAGIYHEAAKRLPTEVQQHDSAEEQSDEAKQEIRSLSNSLNRTARALEDTINGLLHLRGEVEIQVDLLNSTNDVADYEDFTAQVKSEAAHILKANVTINNAFENFKNDLVKYKNALSRIGGTMEREDKEARDVQSATERYRPLVMSLNQLLFRYFGYTNHALYEKWTGKSRYPKKKSVAGEADEQ